MGVEITDSIEAMLDKVDVVLIEPMMGTKTYPRPRKVNSAKKHSSSINL